jgi:hypothetical protein
MQRHNFALTTRQAARLRGVEPHRPYSNFKRKGHWDGVIPVKLPNGRLLWNRDDILRAEGIVLVDGPLPVDIRVWLSFVEEAGLPVEDTGLRAIGLRLLNHNTDKGRDPAYMLDELVLLAELNTAFADRLDSVLKNMTPADLRRAHMMLRFIVGTLSAFFDEDGDSKGAETSR